MKSFGEDPTIDPDLFYDAFYDRENAQWERMYEGFNAAVDWPTASYWRELYTYYPEAKVILTVRTADSWYQSMASTVAARPRPGQVHEADDPTHPRRRFFRMGRATILDGRIEEFHDKEEEMKFFFLNHNEEVKRTIPESRLLVMELGDGWDKLCEFLGKDIPDVPYPNVNSSALHHEYTQSQRRKYQKAHQRK